MHFVWEKYLSNFQSLEVVSRYRDPQLQVTENWKICRLLHTLRLQFFHIRCELHLCERNIFVIFGTDLFVLIYWSHIFLCEVSPNNLLQTFRNTFLLFRVESGVRFVWECRCQILTSKVDPRNTISLISGIVWPSMLIYWSHMFVCKLSGLHHVDVCTPC